VPNRARWRIWKAVRVAEYDCKSISLLYDARHLCDSLPLSRRNVQYVISTEKMQEISLGPVKFCCFLKIMWPWTSHNNSLLICNHQNRHCCFPLNRSRLKRDEREREWSPFGCNSFYLTTVVFTFFPFEAAFINIFLFLSHNMDPFPLLWICAPFSFNNRSLACPVDCLLPVTFTRTRCAVYLGLLVCVCVCVCNTASRDWHVSCKLVVVPSLFCGDCLLAANVAFPELLSLAITFIFWY